MSEVNKDDYRLQDAMLVVLLVIAIIGVFIVAGHEALNSYAPEKRAEQIEYAEKNYSFLNKPEKKFNSRFDDRKRRIVFLTQAGCHYTLLSCQNLEDMNLALLYVAEVESKVGHQDWLDEGYRTYAFTEEELKKVAALEKAYNEKQRYKAFESVRPIDNEEKHVAMVPNANEVLKERALLAKR